MNRLKLGEVNEFRQLLSNGDISQSWIFFFQENTPFN